MKSFDPALSTIIEYYMSQITGNSLFELQRNPKGRLHSKNLTTQLQIKYRVGHALTLQYRRINSCHRGNNNSGIAENQQKSTTDQSPYYNYQNQNSRNTFQPLTIYKTNQVNSGL
ncbi:Hypothetical_protein [Hexamita inflata]|uniref:Hypothetical_protein n=1 Tax=Hexamita inflata TaxID=28002 RepID=A0AA86UES1_9EUKA|nr:Hypothetical protein HINF_LOCUS25893 [Hexamita inflata]CAI9938249.1 Hypothetical protein HINF_LOCUS25894 [Hexamita inflata]